VTVRAIVFDCDGVLVDSEPHSVAAWLDLASELGHPATGFDVARCTGLGFVETRAHLATLGPLPPPGELWPQLLEALSRSFGRGLAVFPDAIEVLDAAERRRKIAVASASPRQRLDLTLEAAGLIDRFRVSVAGDEVLAGKPDPDVYLAALEGLGVEPGAAVAVEDSAPGVTAAHRAGIRVVAVARDAVTRGALAEAGAALVVERLEPGQLGL